MTGARCQKKPGIFDDGATLRPVNHRTNPLDLTSTIFIVRVDEHKTNSEDQYMKAIATTLLILASVLAIHFAMGASGPDRPQGVDADSWIAVSDKLGFVLTTPRAAWPSRTAPQALLLSPSPEEGYFMVRVGNSWQRIIIINPIKGPGTAG
jgi:hypothetical protein